jgi:predicted house-cleaning NTP pyrophosphatase (Maf/HAM1 superfamily)
MEELSFQKLKVKVILSDLKSKGCYNNIVGIPLYAVCKLLMEKMKEAEWIKK